MAAGHYKLDNLCGIVGVNGLQIDGWVKDVMNVQPFSEKYAAFGWNVIEIDGNDMRQILDAFARARETSGRPTVILARTIKGKALPELLTPDFPRSRVGRRCPSVSTRENCRWLRTKFAPSVTIDLSSFAPPYRVGQSDPQLYVCVPG